MKRLTPAQLYKRRESMSYFTHLENGGIELAQRIVEANQNAKSDTDLRNKFALIHEYALALLRDADKTRRINKG